MILSKNIFFQELELKTTTSKLMEEIFMISLLMTQSSKVRQIPTGQGDDYTTSCLLDFAYFEKIYRLIAVDSSKQKALDADASAIQQFIFTGKTNSTVANAIEIVYYILD